MFDAAPGKTRGRTLMEVTTLPCAVTASTTSICHRQLHVHDNRAFLFDSAGMVSEFSSFHIRTLSVSPLNQAVAARAQGCDAEEEGAGGNSSL
jgi:hypothetical protein